LRAFVQRWIITTLAVLVAANIVKGIDYDSVAGLLVASLLLGILNALLRPVMILVSLPLLVFSVGLFMLVINAVLLYLVGWLVKSFHVESFGAAFWGGLVISVVSLIAHRLTGAKDNRVVFRYQKRGQGRPPDTGSGPVIDV
jgi:putative membrane protein